MSLQSTLALLVFAAVIASAAGWRSVVARRLERVTRKRLAVGATGVVTGAEEFSVEAQSGRVVLLLHGFGDTPQTVRYLADHLVGYGFAVRAPLLPGHGRTLPEFAASRSEDWLKSAREELQALLQRYAEVSIVGVSMGGALASILASEELAISALVLIAPYLDMPSTVRRVARWHRVLGATAVYVTGRGSERSIHDPEERSKALSYRASTPRLLFELSKVADLGRSSLPGISAPTMIIQSREDNRVAPEVAQRAHATIGAKEKRLVWLDGCGHIVTVDHGREAVFRMVAEWIATHQKGAVVYETPGPRI